MEATTCLLEKLDFGLVCHSETIIAGISSEDSRCAIYLTDILFSFPLHPRCNGLLIDLKEVRKKSLANPFVSLDFCIA
jgi:hypothetical protein